MPNISLYGRVSLALWACAALLLGILTASALDAAASNPAQAPDQATATPTALPTAWCGEIRVVFACEIPQRQVAVFYPCDGSPPRALAPLTFVGVAGFYKLTNITRTGRTVTLAGDTCFQVEEIRAQVGENFDSCTQCNASLGPTVTPSVSRTATPSYTPSQTPEPTSSRTPTLTHTPSLTPEPTHTRTITPTPSDTPEPTSTRTPTVTQTPTLTPEPTDTRTPTLTPEPTDTRTPTLTRTATLTPEPTNTRTITPTPSPTPEPTETRTPTRTWTPTQTLVATSTHTRTPTRTVSPTTAPTDTRTPTVTRTLTPVPSLTSTRTLTPTPTLKPPTPTFVPGSFAISVDRGPGSTYDIGDPVRIGYVLPYYPASIQILRDTIEGSALLTQGIAAGPGFINRIVTSPSGPRSYRLVLLDGSTVIAETSVDTFVTHRVTIAVDRGPGSTYYLGDPITITFSTSRAMEYIITNCPSGSACFELSRGTTASAVQRTLLGTIGLTPGPRTYRIDGYVDGVLVASASVTFIVAQPVPPTPTLTRTATASPTHTPTRTLTPIPPTATATRTATPTLTPIPPTATRTATVTLTPIPPTATRTVTRTATPPVTLTPTATLPGGGPTLTPGPSPTRTATPSLTPIPPTATRTATVTLTSTATATPTITLTRTATATASHTATATVTATLLPGTTPTTTRTVTITLTPTQTPTPRPATATPMPGCTDDGYENNNGFPQAYLLVYGETVNAVICPSEDLDIFRLRVRNGDEITLRLSNQPAPFAMYLYDENANELEAREAIQAGDKVIVYRVEGVPNDGANYYLMITTLSLDYNPAQRYNFLATRVTLVATETPTVTATPGPGVTATLTPPPTSTATATTAISVTPAPTGTRTSTVTPGPSPTATWTATPGPTSTVTLTPTLRPPTQFLYIPYVARMAPGLSLPTPTLTPTKPPSATPTSPAAPTVTPTVGGCQDAYEPDNGQSQAKPISVDAPAQTHTFHAAGDADWAYFVAEAGRTYDIRTAELASNVDTVLALFNASGVRIAFDDDSGGGGSSRIMFTASVAGTYFIRVTNYDTAFGACEASYQLRVTLSN